MNGIEVLREVKHISDDTEVIIITGHGDIDSAIEALHYGASDFINKPVRDKQLTIALKRAQDKIHIKQQLREYTTTLEHKVEAATREIRRRSNFQGKLIRSSNDGIVATDEELRIVIYNPGAERIFGYPQQGVIHRMQIQEALHPGNSRFVCGRGDARKRAEGVSLAGNIDRVWKWRKHSGSVFGVDSA